MKTPQHKHPVTPGFAKPGGDSWRVLQALGLAGALCAAPMGWAAGKTASGEGFDGRGRLSLPASPQRIGDAARGRDYLFNGDYLSSGVPLVIYRASRGQHRHNELQRKDENASLPPTATAVLAPNGQTVVTANCMACHAQHLNGRFVFGLGNSLRDFTVDAAATANRVDLLLSGPGKEIAAMREAFAPFRDAIRVVGPHIRPQVRGVNPAVKLAYVLAAHRDPATLRWSAVPHLPLPPEDEVIPSDVPAWWLLRKKQAMFHNGMGRGDFARIMMASSLLTLRDAAEAKEIDARFVDVLAYLKTLRPPSFPDKVDAALAARGAEVFEHRCASCHGRYGEHESYPNLLIQLDRIGTDPELARSASATYREQGEAYNASWFGQEPHAARLEPHLGYVAPPLDGVWATAPYLHNGSVPTLEALLDSSLRPRFWQRSFRSDDYDLKRVGWNFHEEPRGGAKQIYDTTLHGYSAAGHTFGDDLEPEQRRAVLEYLKTL